MKSMLAITLLDMFMKVETITSIILVMFGVALSCLAARITRAVRKTSEVRSDDKLLLILRIIGLVLMVVGLLVMMLGCLN